MRGNWPEYSITLDYDATKFLGVSVKLKGE